MKKKKSISSFSSERGDKKNEDSIGRGHDRGDFHGRGRGRGKGHFDGEEKQFSKD